MQIILKLDTSAIHYSLLAIHYSSQTLPFTVWQQAAQAHRRKAEAWTLPYRDRRTKGKLHPVHDFLFIYYRFAPSQLEHWHPSFGVLLETLDSIPEKYSDKYYSQGAIFPSGLNRSGSARASSHRTGFAANITQVRTRDGDALPHPQKKSRPYSHSGNILFQDPEKIDAKARKRLQWSLDLCRSVEQRAAHFRCFGMHEWAMVYQGGPEGRPRHEGTLGLRLPQTEIDDLVRNQLTGCSHFDAFRFFTASAKPFNRLYPTQDTRLHNEQPGCLHTNMDLYKWTAKSMPWVGSDLLWDTFEYAVHCREIDMRASPYDCTPLGLQPIRIETPEGRAEYESEQRKLTEAGKPLRTRLIAALEAVASPDLR